jgi:hypothetical protein
MSLDENELRRRLAGLADRSAVRLDEGARARVLDRIERRGPAIVRRARIVRIATPLALLAAAAAVLASIWGVPAAPTPIAAGPACSRWSAARGTPREGVLQLGRRGSARVHGRLSLHALDGCTTELSLDDGRADVHADDLGEGALRVVAGDIVVEVRGTRFSVVREGRYVAVFVAEGHVVVRAPDRREIHLRNGERWSRGAREDLTREREAPVRPQDETSVVSEDPPSSSRPEPHRREHRSPAIEEPAPTAREQLTRAEALWREGDQETARRLFAAVGEGSGALAEAAWIRLARLELGAGESGRALRAARIQQARFPQSRLGAEALWIEADALRRSGADPEGALRRLRERYPDSPQARAADREPR